MWFVKIEREGYRFGGVDILVGRDIDARSDGGMASEEK